MHKEAVVLDLVGKSFGQYKIKALLGVGGMACVYRARQPSMNRDVAIKVISDALSLDQDFVRRFKREAQIYAGLQHPHILPVIDFGSSEGRLYIVMRLVVGSSLDQHIRDVKMPLALVSRITEQVGSALSFAHRKGIIHRDLKPSNVLLDEDENAYLTDFGIAKMLADDSTQTASHAVMGTPSYMAPEQWRDEPVDARTDVYSMGIMLYQMISGQLPYHAETPFSLMHKHLNEAPPPIRGYVADLSEHIERVILKAIAKEPGSRFQSAEELSQAIRSAVDAQTSGKTASAPYDADNSLDTVDPFWQPEQNDAETYFETDTLGLPSEALSPRKGAPRRKRKPKPPTPTRSRSSTLIVMMAMGLVISLVALGLGIFGLVSGGNSANDVPLPTQAVVSAPTVQSEGRMATATLTAEEEVFQEIMQGEYRCSRFFSTMQFDIPTTVEVSVPEGKIAILSAVELDRIDETVLVTIEGPYQNTHEGLWVVFCGDFEPEQRAELEEYFIYTTCGGCRQEYFPPNVTQ